jgi:chromosome partitioning protein
MPYSEDGPTSSLRHIIVHNHKGGTGKTMIAVHLAEYLVDHGQSWHVLDADPQCNAISWLTAHKWSGEDALQLPGGGRRPAMIVSVEPGVVADEDHLVVDTAPAGDALRRLHESGVELVPDDLILCPINGRFGIDGVIKVAEEAAPMGPRVVAVMNMTDPSDEHATEEIRALRELEEVGDLGIEVFKMAIPYNATYIRKALLQGTPVWEVPYARRTHTVQALEALARWVAQGAPPEANRIGGFAPAEASHQKQRRVNELQDRLWG